MRIDFPDGRTHFYKSEITPWYTRARLARVVFPYGETDFYEGSAGAERLVRIELSDGRTHFYKGEKGAERVVQAVLPDGRTQFRVRVTTSEQARMHEFGVGSWM